jgi:hypothetical protein
MRPRGIASGLMKAMPGFSCAKRAENQVAQGAKQ